MSLNLPSATWRLSTIGGIKYKLVEHSGAFGRDEATATERYLIRADDLYAFAVESMPPPFVLLNTIFYPPARPLPGLPALRTTRVSWKGFPEGKPIDPFGADPVPPAGTYEPNVEVTIEYSTGDLPEPDENDPGTFLEISADAGMEFLNSPTRGNMEWEDGDEVREGDVPHVVKSFETDWDLQAA